MSEELRICILGAGVSGLTTAHALLEQFSTVLIRLDLLAHELPFDEKSTSSHRIRLSHGREIPLVRWKNDNDVTYKGQDISGAVFHHVCSRVAAASFLPHSSGTRAPSKRQEKWLRKSAAEFLPLVDVRDGMHGDSGVRLVDGMECFANGHSHTPWWSSICTLDFEHVDLAKAVTKGASSSDRKNDTDHERLLMQEYKTAWKFRLPIIDTSVYLPFTLSRVERSAHRGGHTLRIIQCDAPVRSLQTELCEKYDVVINCAGIGAIQLEECHGQDPGCGTGVVGGVVVIEREPGVEYKWFRDDTAHNKTAYVYPRVNDVVLGGNRLNVRVQRDNHRHGIVEQLRAVDWPVEMKQIIERCVQLNPQVRNAKILRAGVCGVRPSRTGGIRVEAMPIHNGLKHSRCKLIVSNYGHGGEGYCYSYGSAQEAAQLVLSHLSIKSRL